MNKLQIAEQMRKVLQMFCVTLSDEAAMVVPAVYDEWAAGMSYKARDILRHGVNSVGDPQLYRVVQSHTSQMGWQPQETAAFYTPIGLTDDGYPVWAQPTGAHDAYNEGDVVGYEGKLYVSTIDGNVYAPGVYGWVIFEEG